MNAHRSGTLAATALLCCGIAAAATLPSPAQSPAAQPSGDMVPPAKSGPVMNIPLTENGKPGGTPGMAVLSQSGPDVIVTIEDPTPASADRAVVIYKGACAKPSAQSAYKLQPVSKGKSQSTLKGTTVTKLSSGGYALAVNGSPRLCADLVQVNPIPATQQTP
jgi:hypothetical protein